MVIPWQTFGVCWLGPGRERSPHRLQTTLAVAVPWQLRNQAVEMSAGEGGRWEEGRGENERENSQGGDQCTCTLHASTYHGILTQLVYGSLPRLSLLCCVLTHEKWFGLSQFSLLRTFSLSVSNSYIALPTTYMKLGRLQTLHVWCLIQSDWT